MRQNYQEFSQDARKPSCQEAKGHACMIDVWQPIRRHLWETTPRKHMVCSVSGMMIRLLIDGTKVYIQEVLQSQFTRNLRHCIYNTPVRKKLERSPDEVVSSIASIHFTGSGGVFLETHVFSILSELM